MAAPDTVFSAETLDLDLLASLHRHRRLFIAYQPPGAAEPCTLILDGDSHAMVDELLQGAILARDLRLEIHLRPFQQARKAVATVLAALSRRRGA